MLPTETAPVSNRTRSQAQLLSLFRRFRRFAVGDFLRRSLDSHAGAAVGVPLVADFLLDFLGDFRMPDQEGAGILAALADTFLAVLEPCPVGVHLNLTQGFHLKLTQP